MNIGQIHDNNKKNLNNHNQSKNILIEYFIVHVDFSKDVYKKTLLKRIANSIDRFLSRVFQLDSVHTITQKNAQHYINKSNMLVEQIYTGKIDKQSQLKFSIDLCRSLDGLSRKDITPHQNTVIQGIIDSIINNIKDEYLFKFYPKIEDINHLSSVIEDLNKFKDFSYDVRDRLLEIITTYREAIEEFEMNNYKTQRSMVVKSNYYEEDDDQISTELSRQSSQSQNIEYIEYEEADYQ